MHLLVQRENENKINEMLFSMCIHTKWTIYIYIYMIRCFQYTDNYWYWYFCCYSWYDCVSYSLWLSDKFWAWFILNCNDFKNDMNISNMLVDRYFCYIGCLGEYKMNKKDKHRSMHIANEYISIAATSSSKWQNFIVII